ncbi:MAG: zinc-ribbon domain-containing protein [Deltaproteobacteria bacterium]|nr:zinc-ribbon domain-containing protein [Deltaproteobacteria bacterium]
MPLQIPHIYYDMGEEHPSRDVQAVAQRHLTDPGGAPDEAGKIKVVCHACGARYRVRDQKIRGKRFRATCKRCGGIIVARCENAAFTVMSVPEAERQTRGRAMGAAQTGAVQIESRELHQDDEQVWYVAVDGKPTGPFSAQDLGDQVATGRASARSYGWRAGQAEWRRLEEIPELVEVVGERKPTQHVALHEAMKGGGRWPEGEDPDAPTAYHQRDEPEDEPTRLRPFPSNATEAAPTLDPRGGGQWPDGGPASTVPGGRVGGAGGYSVPVGELPAHAAMSADHGGWSMPPRRRAILPSPSRPWQAGELQPGALEPQPNATHAGPANLNRTLDGPPPAALYPQQAAYGAVTMDPGPVQPVPSVPHLSQIGIIPPLDQLPPPPALGALAPVGTEAPPPPVNLLTPVESFWTTDKVIAAAAIGGGLAVATVVAVVAIFVAPKKRAQPARTVTVVAAAQPNQATATAGGEAPAPAVPAATVPPAAPAPAAEAAPGAPAAAEARAAAPQPAPAVPIIVKTEAPASAPAKESAEGDAEEDGETEGAKGQKSSRGPPSKGSAGTSSDGEGDREGGGDGQGTRVKAKLKPASSKRSASSDGNSRPKAKKRTDDGAGDALASGGGEPSRPKAKRASAAALSADPDAILAAGSAGARSAEGKPSRPSKGQVKSAMAGLRPQVANCFRQFKTPGNLQVKVTVRPDGSATGTVVGSFAGTPLGSCVSSGVPKLTFPSFTGNPFSFVYPFTLQ